jgi:cytochrome c2
MSNYRLPPLHCYEELIMLRTSAAIGILGLVLLVASALPWETRTAAPADSDYGKLLFTAKGCADCHMHAAVATRAGAWTTNIGPNLTGYQPDPAFVRRWLHDPRAVRPTTQMPNLNLSDSEIDALIAFLQVSAKK